MKRLIRGFKTRLAAELHRDTPLESWPGWAGKALGINVPANVVPRPEASPRGGPNIRMIAELLGRTAQIKGDVAECGVYRGATLLAMGLMLKGSSRQLHGFDTFEGIDEAPSRDFTRTSLPYVRSRIELLRLGGTVELHTGLFAETLPAMQEASYSFVHLDCVTYEGYRDSLEYFYRRVSAGGVILLDEYNDPPWPGCKRAVDEFLADRPESVEQIVRDGFEKYAIYNE